MVSNFGRDLKPLLLDHGCRFVRRGKGNHEICLSPLTNLTFGVDRGMRKRFTAEAVPNQAGNRARL